MEQVRKTLDAINQAWQDRRFDALNTMFDEGMVMRGSGLKELVRGREAIIHSYAQFMAQSTVRAYSESNHVIDHWGDVACATYDWAMTYKQGTETKTENGQDMFVFTRRGSAWIAILRLISF